LHSPVVEEDEVSVLVGGLGRLGNNTRVEGALLLMILSYRITINVPLFKKLRDKTALETI
jgi:hypothetical protein